MNESTSGFESLYLSHLKAQRTVIWKDSVAWYSLHALEQTLKLSNELCEERYKPKPPVEFVITKPKRREILAVAYRDRVYQRSINDNVLYPTMVRTFVKENGACQIGKGVDYERNLFKQNLRRFYINHGINGYILQIDVKKYYGTMQHSVVYDCFHRQLSDEDFKLVYDVLESQYKGDIGYSAGSQMVQIAGISYLSGIDHYAKEKLHLKYYTRYMDDIVIIHNNPDYLKYCRDEIEKELNLIGLKSHEKKTKIMPIANGITFLGFDWKLTPTGKVLMFVKSQTVKDMKRSITQLMRLYADGRRTLHCVEESYRTRRAYIAKANSYKLLQRLDAWYKERINYYGLKEKQSDTEGKKRTGKPESYSRKDRRTGFVHSRHD